MQAGQKLIDYFLVVGLDRDLKKCDSVPEEEKYIVSLNLCFGYKSTEIKPNINEKWIDLDGYKTVWLKVTFGNASSAIADVDFLSVPIKADHEATYPVPITQLKNEDLNKDFEEDQKLLLAQSYDLTEILGFEKTPDHATVLCYKIKSPENSKACLEDISIVNGERKRGAKDISRESIIIEAGYECIKRRFVNKEKTFKCLIYKRGRDMLAESFQSIVLDRYPQSTTSETQAILFNIQQFCFPNGIKLSRQIREPTSFSFILTKESGDRVYGTTLVFDEDFSEEFKSDSTRIEFSKTNPLFSQKAICLLSHHSFLSEFKEILKQIYRIHLSKTEIPIEVKKGQATSA